MIWRRYSRCAPLRREWRILLLGMAKSEGEFLRCVRAGISGYLLHDASCGRGVWRGTGGARRGGGLSRDVVHGAVSIF